MQNTTDTKCCSAHSTSAPLACRAQHAQHTQCPISAPCMQPIAHAKPHSRHHGHCAYRHGRRRCHHRHRRCWAQESHSHCHRRRQCQRAPPVCCCPPEDCPIHAAVQGALQSAYCPGDYWGWAGWSQGLPGLVGVTAWEAVQRPGGAPHCPHVHDSLWGLLAAHQQQQQHQQQVQRAVLPHRHPVQQ